MIGTGEVAIAPTMMEKKMARQSLAVYGFT